LRLIVVFALVAGVCTAELTPVQQKQNLDSFEYVWATIRDKYWDRSLEGAEWKRAHDELLPRLQQSDSMTAARKVMQEMIDRLHMTHFAIVPGDLYPDLTAHGSANLDVRVIQGKALVATGKYQGWQITGVDQVIARVSKLYEHSTMRDLMVSRAVLSAAGGGPVEIENGKGEKATIHPDEESPKGEPTHFGFLPTEYVWIESRQIEGVGYVAFNMFLDPERLINTLSAAVRECASCRGFVIDLRGNPGGIGGMAMGMAGFFVSEPHQQLGTMYNRQGPLRFVINPRQPHFDGPLAILVDGLSASTSEIFAEGLQDLGRARVFGTRTAGAALPSVVEKLPNGDMFQYAIANYISQGGKTLEGNGVTPDVMVSPDQESLLAGHDTVLEAALQWLQK
jgi:carboxyl-terminal processing protease